MQIYTKLPLHIAYSLFSYFFVPDDPIPQPVNPTIPARIIRQTSCNDSRIQNKKHYPKLFTMFLYYLYYPVYNNNSQCVRVLTCRYLQINNQLLICCSCRYLFSKICTTCMPKTSYLFLVYFNLLQDSRFYRDLGGWISPRTNFNINLISCCFT